MELAKKDLSQAKTALAHCVYALCLRDEGDLRGALEHLESLSGGAADDKNVLSLQITLMHRLAEVERGDKLVEKLEKKYPDDTASLRAKAIYCEENGDPQTALDLYRQVVSADPGDEEALFSLANLLDRFGLDEEALKCYERLNEVFPVHVSAVLNLGQIHYERGDTEQASFCFKRVLKYRPNNALAQRFLKDVDATENMYYDEIKAKKVEELNKILLIPVTDFELSVRSRNCLSRMNIRTLGDLIQKTEADLLSYKNFGETSLAEIKRMLASKNLYLGMAKDMQNQELREKQKRKIIDTTNTELLQKSIDDLELSVRASKCLRKMGVNVFGDLIKLSDATLLKMRNFGQTSLNEIKQKLATYGLSLASE
jgi:DNA-directed RNA polymerase subunit alpha